MTNDAPVGSEVSANIIRGSIDRLLQTGRDPQLIGYADQAGDYSYYIHISINGNPKAELS